MNIIASINFHLVKILVNKYHPKPKEKCIYLTFDDGPESDITEYILSVLRENNIKATFFCCGKNIEKNPMLFNQILNEGHCIGNHTYSHINGLKVPLVEYLHDVDKGAQYTHATLFRPPWGALSILSYLRLQKKYRIFLWDIVSNDTLKIVNFPHEIQRMRKELKPGDIVLFHFVQKHAYNTKVLLPAFIQMAKENGYSFDVLK